MYELKDGIKGCLVALAISFGLGLIKTFAFKLYWSSNDFLLLLSMLIAAVGFIGAIVAIKKYIKSDFFEFGGILGKFGLVYIILSVFVMLFY